ncbi:TPA: hypothetical protein ACH3X3_013007 [Trebouxia sp. C0006]
MACHAVQHAPLTTAHCGLYGSFKRRRSCKTDFEWQSHRCLQHVRREASACCMLGCRHHTRLTRCKQNTDHKQHVTLCRAVDKESRSQQQEPDQHFVNPKQQDHSPASRWQVPWGAGQVTRLMLQIWALEAVSVPLLTQLRGLSLAETSMSDKAITAAAVQFLKLLGAVLIVRRALLPYKPLPPNWYKYKLDGEAVGLGISGGVTALCLTLLTAAVTGAAAAQNTGTVKTLLGDGQTSTVAAIAAASVIGAPLLEEFTYRGFLLPSLTRWLPTPAAVFAQAVVFAGSHASPGDLIPLTALGVCLGTVTVAAEGNLIAPILAHAIYNGAVLYVIVK